jgi:nucleotide-binding universal stress UspA family protein
MKRILIVANQTAGGAHLRDEVSRLIGEGATRFTLLVPATRPKKGLTWTEGTAHALAEERMERAIAALSDLGAEFDGQVGVERPMDAVMDILRAHDFDEIIVSTLPHGVSHWLRADLPARVARHSGLPVHHIVGVVEEHRATA